MNLLKSRLGCVLALAMLCGLASRDASAQTTYGWTGGSGTSSSFTLGANWSGGSVALTSGSYATRWDVNNGATNPALTYSAAQGYTILNPANRALVIGGVTSDSSMIITGGTLQLGGNATSGIGVGGRNASLTINGGVFNSGTNMLEMGLLSTTGGTNRLTMTSGSAIIRRLGLIGTGSGALSIVDLNGGTLSLGGLVLTGTAQFNFNGGLLQATETSGTWFGAGSNPYVNVRDGGARIDTNGFDVTVAAALRHSVLAGDAAIDGGLRKSGAGTLTLSGSNAYTGTTSIAAGALTIGNANALLNSTLDMASADSGTISFSQNSTLGGLTGSRNIDMGTRTLSIGNNNASTTYSGQLSNGALTKIGSGALTLSGSNTYAGTTTVSSGELKVTGAYTGAAAGSRLVVNSGSATFDMGTGSAVYYGDGFTNALNVGYGNASSTGLLTVQSGTVSILTQTGAGTGYGSLSIGGGAVGANGTVVVNGGALNSSGRILIAANASTGQGTLTITGGQVTIGNNSAAYTNGSADPGNGVLWYGSGTSTVNLNSGTLSMFGNRASTPSAGSAFNFNGGTLKALATNNSDFLTALSNVRFNVQAGGAIIDDSGFGVTISSNLLAGSGSGGLTKLGSGTLTLSGSNAYTGATTINAGLLQISNANALRNSTLNMAAGDSGTVAFAQNSTLGGLSGSRNIDVTTRVLTIGNNDASTTYSGTLTNVGGLTKIGAGDLVLSGSIGVANGTAYVITNSGAGSLTISGIAARTGQTQTLQADAGSGSFLVSGTLGGSNNSTILAGSGTGTVSGVIDNPFAVVKTGNGTWRLTGNSTHTATARVEAGTLQIGDSGTTGVLTVGGAVSGSSGATLAFNRIDDYGGNFNSVVSGSLRLQLNSGTLTLGGANTSYTGTTAINAGMLVLNNASALGSSGDITFGGGTLQYTSNNTANYASRIKNSGSAILIDTNSQSVTFSSAIDSTNTGGLQKLGSGTLALSGSNSYTGNTVLSAGQLNLGNANALSSGALVINGGAIGNSAGSAVTIASNNAQSWNGDFAFAGTNPLNLGTGAVTLGANRTVTVSSSTLTVGGGIGGAFSLTKSGTGTLILSGSNNTYSGNTTVSAGTLQIGDGSSLTGSLPGNVLLTNTSGLSFNSSSDQTYAGLITGTGTLTKAGAGTLTLSAVGNVVNRGLTLAGGGILNSGSISMGGATLSSGTFTNTSTGQVIATSDVTVSGASLVNSGTFSQSSYLNFGGQGSASIVNSGVMNWGGWFYGSGSGTGGEVTTFTNNAGGSLTTGDTIWGSTKFISFTNAGGTYSVVSGLSIGRSNGSTATGTTSFTVASGTVTAGSSGGISLYVSGSVSNATIDLNLNGGRFVSGTSIDGSITSTGTGNAVRVNFGGGTLVGSRTNQTLLPATLSGVTLNAGGGTIELGSGITGTAAAAMSGVGGLTKTGAGTLVLSGSNTYTGTTTINAGSLTISNTNALQNSTLDMASADAGTISFSQNSTLGGLTGSRNIDMGTRTLSIGNNNASTTYSGSLSNGGLAKVGTGTLTLSGTNVLGANNATVASGGMLINTGSLSMAAVVNSGSFRNQGQLTATGAVETAGSPSSAASFVNLSTGTVTATGNFTLRGFLSGTNSGRITSSGGGFFVGANNGGLTGDTLPMFTNAAGGVISMSNDLTLGREFFGAFVNEGSVTTTNVFLGRTDGVTLAGTSSLTMTSGTVQASGQVNMRITGAVSNALAQVNLNGGLLSLTSTTLGVTTNLSSTGTNNRAVFNFGGGTLRSVMTSGTLLPSTFNEVNLNAGGGTIELTGTSTVAATMSGIGGLTKTGAGRLILAASNNTYSGNTTVSAGTLQIGDGSTAAGSLPGNVLLTNTTGLIFNSTVDQSYAGLITGTGTLTKAGAGATLTLSGNGNVVRQGLTLTSGGILNTGSLSAGSGANTGNSTLNSGTFANQGQLSLVGSIGVNSGARFVNTGTVTQGVDSFFQVSQASSADNTGLMNVDFLRLNGSAGSATPATFVNNANGNMTLGTLIIGNDGDGSFTNNGGRVTIATTQLTIGRGTGSTSGTSSLTVASGTVTNNQQNVWRLGGYGSASNSAGEINLNGGLFETVGSIALTTSTGANNTARVNFNGGTLRGLTNNAALLAANLTGVSLGAGGGTIDLGAGITGTAAAAMTGVGGLTKTGAGILVLSGSNGFSGLTSISAGSIDFGSINALRNSSGVNIAGGGTLRYTGGAASFDRNISVTSSGTGTVTNSGGGLLTLAGTLTKDGTVLRLTGGQFNVTGQIVGTSAGSDLVVDGTSTVTLSNTNTYNGPTFVNQASNLIVNVNDAIPSNSVVTLGNATTTGTLSLGSFSNAIGGLAFGSAGGTLRVSANATGAAQLSSASGTMALANGRLDLTGSGTTAGLYRVLSAQSITGAFSGTTGLSAAYQILATGSTFDLQQRSVLGAVSVTNTTASIITGGVAAFTYSVTNGAASGGQALSFTGTGLSNIGGSSFGTANAGGSSGPVSGLSFTGTTVGLGQVGTFTVTDPAAFGGTSLTGTVSLNVLNHSLASFTGTDLSSLTLDFGTYSLGSWTGGDGGNGALGYNVFNIASGGFTNSQTADLDLYDIIWSSGDDVFSTGATTFQNLQAGLSNPFTATVAGPGGLANGTYQGVYTLRFRDQQNLSGATNTRDLTLTMKVIVVPEPGSIALAGIGIAAAGWARWKRRRRS